MPRINFTGIPDEGLIPEGQYPCVVADIDEKISKKGDEYWRLKLQVQGEEVPETGQFLWDSLFFSDNAIKRVKLVCRRFGLDVSKDMDLEPKHLLGRKALVDVIIEKYEDYKTGESRKRNSVPYAGYEKISGESVASSVAAPVAKDELTDELPF